MTIKSLAVAALGCCFFALPAAADVLVSWNKTVASNFSAQQCLTIHGTPGTPQHCAPSKSVPYYCGSFKHPKKTCHHTIPGPCTPAVPGIPDRQQCATVSPGAFSIAVDGGVYTQFDGIEDSEVAVQTTVHVSLFGKHAAVPLTCKITIGTETSICLNLLTGSFAKSNASGYSCEIGGVDLASISYPGVTANFCMDVSVGGEIKKPGGSLTARVEADVQFGGASIAGQSVSMGSKGWNPTLFNVKF